LGEGRSCDRGSDHQMRNLHAESFVMIGGAERDATAWPRVLTIVKIESC
jgi:hypothetical protein